MYMRLPLRPWIYKNLLILGSLASVLYIHFHFPGFVGLRPNFIQSSFFDYAIPSLAGLIVFGGTGLFGWSNLKHYKLISNMFSLPLVCGIVVYLIDHDLLPFLWFFFLALLAQTLELFIILSTRKKPSTNLILTIIFCMMSACLTQLFVDFDVSLKQARFESSPLSQPYINPGQLQ